jgi:hypothetical protein
MNSDHAEFYSLKADLSDFKFSGLRSLMNDAYPNGSGLMERFDGYSGRSTGGAFKILRKKDSCDC